MALPVRVALQAGRTRVEGAGFAVSGFGCDVRQRGVRKLGSRDQSSSSTGTPKSHSSTVSVLVARAVAA